MTAAVDWAFEQKPGSASAKLVLLTLARLAEDGSSCIVTQEALAEASEQSLASVGRALRLLVTQGLIRREARRDDRGHRTSDRYHLLAPESLHVKLPTRQNANHANSQVGNMQTSSDLPTRQSANHANCESLRSSPTENSLFPSPTGKGGVGGNQTGSSTRSVVGEEHPRFAEFYAAYPVHKARGAAVRAFTKAAARASPQTLVDAAKRYRDDPQVQRGYGKHPATWLNQDCWLDEPAGEQAATGTEGRPGGARANVNDQWKDQEFRI